MDPDEFQNKLQETNDEIKNIMQNHELINEFDQTIDTIHPAFRNLSQLLLDYIINVNEKITTLIMASFFEDQFPEMVRSDPFVFSDPDAVVDNQTVLAEILRPTYENILQSNDQYQKQISIYRYINILSNINEEISSLSGESVDLIKQTIQQLYLQPIEIEEVY